MGAHSSLPVVTETEEELKSLAFPHFYTECDPCENDYILARKSWNKVIDDTSTMYLSERVSTTFTFTNCFDLFLFSFGNRFGEIFPSVMNTYLSDRQIQTRCIIGAISIILNHLHTRPELEHIAVVMVKKHAEVGIKCTQYGQYGDVLLWTLEKCLGSIEFDDATHQAWIVVISKILRFLIPIAVEHDFRLQELTDDVATSSTKTSLNESPKTNEIAVPANNLDDCVNLQPRPQTPGMLESNFRVKSFKGFMTSRMRSMKITSTVCDDDSSPPPSVDKAHSSKMLEAPTVAVPQETPSQGIIQRITSLSHLLLDTSSRPGTPGRRVAGRNKSLLGRVDEAGGVVVSAAVVDKQQQLQPLQAPPVPRFLTPAMRANMLSFIRSKALKRWVLVQLAKTVRSEEDIKHLNAMFLRIDINGDGAVCMSDIGGAMAAQGEGHLLDELREVLAASSVTNKDIIGFVEFSASVIDPTFYIREQNLRWMYQQLHPSPDTVLNFECVKTIAADVKKREFDQIDANKDGVISYEEFKAMMQNVHFSSRRYVELSSKRAAGASSSLRTMG